MPHGEVLIRFAATLLGRDVEALDRARNDLRDALGDEGVTAASITAAAFSLVDRAANGVGIWVEPMVLKPSADFRAAMGINRFPSAQNTFARPD